MNAGAPYHMLLNFDNPMRYSVTEGAPGLSRRGTFCRPQTFTARDLTCICGQPLEYTHSTHCPRCGVLLHQGRRE